MIRRRVLLVAAIAALFGCGDHATGPIDASAVVSLRTPNTDDGAVMVKLQGRRVGPMRASNSHSLLFTHLVSDSETQVLVVGDLTSGPLFTVHVTGTNPLSLIATLEQVATRSDSLRTSLSGYTATVTASP